MTPQKVSGAETIANYSETSTDIVLVVTFPLFRSRVTDSLYTNKQQNWPLTSDLRLC